MRKTVFILILFIFHVSQAQMIAVEEFPSLSDEEKIETYTSFGSESKRDLLKWVFEAIDSEVFGDEDARALLENLFELELIEVDDRNRNAKLSLFDAALQASKFETVKMIVERGYDVNHRCFECDMETSIHVLLMSKQYKDNPVEGFQVFQSLVAAGADLDLRTVQGDTPMHLIIKNEYEDPFRMMLSDSVDFNVQNTTLKGVNFLVFFDKKWKDDELRELLIERTQLTYPPTNREIAQRERELRREIREQNR